MTLVPNPDVLGTVAELAHEAFVVGFAAETHDMSQHAAEKARRKRWILSLSIALAVRRRRLGFELMLERSWMRTGGLLDRLTSDRKLQ